MVANRLVASTVQHLTTIPRPAVSCWSLADSRPDIPRSVALSHHLACPAAATDHRHQAADRFKHLDGSAYRCTDAPITARHGTAQYEVDSDPMDTHCAATTSSTAAA